MSSALKARITDDMKAALRARDKPRLGAIRLIIAAIKQREVDTREEVDDTQALAILNKMVKQRRESIAQYISAGRGDLVAAERFELDVIGNYMPAALNDTEIERLIDAALSATGAQEARDMSKVMGHLKPQLQGRADIASVSVRVRNRLSVR